jgi:uncharacterized membrane protein SpoIIM required for sporulation
MTLDEFVASRQPSWARLEALLARAGGERVRLDAQELADLGRLYRHATADLALAQRDFAGQRVTVYLNQLVGRAHALLYRDQPLQWRRLRDFYAAGFPRLYRQHLPYTTVAGLLFLLPAVVAFLVVSGRPDAVYTILGPGIRDLVREVEAGRLWTEIAPSVRSAAAAFILTNNIRVMFLTFAGGITAGLFTTYVLALNGLHLGAIFGLLQVHGLTAGLAEFVAAHGPIELSVIILAGGCGLSLGDGVLRPGLHSRREAVSQRAQAAVRLILGCVPLLVLAGLIEGFISPSALPWWVKLAVGLVTGLALHGYWLGVGRGGAGTRRGKGAREAGGGEAHPHPSPLPQRGRGNR